MRTPAPQNAHLRKLRLPRIDHSFRPTLEDKPRAPSLSSYFRKFTIVSLSSVPLTRVSHNPGVSLSRTGKRFIWNVNIRRDRAPGPPVSVGGQKPDSHNCQLPDPAGLERALTKPSYSLSVIFHVSDLLPSLLPPPSSLIFPVKCLVTSAWVRMELGSVPSAAVTERHLLLPHSLMSGLVFDTCSPRQSAESARYGPGWLGTAWERPRFTRRTLSLVRYRVSITLFKKKEKHAQPCLSKPRNKYCKNFKIYLLNAGHGSNSFI